MKGQPTRAQDKPVLDERTFQQLLTAAYMLQQHNDRLLAKERKATYAQTLSLRVIAEEVEPPQVFPLTPATITHPVPPMKPARLAHLAYRRRTLNKQFSLTDELFWKVATAVAVASVSALLLGVAVHPSSPLPDGLALSSSVDRQQAPFQKTKRIMMFLTQKGSVGTKTVATELPKTKKAAARTVRTVVAGQLPGSRVNRAKEADLVAEDTLVRYDTRSVAPRLQAQKKP